jgi:hypothetical protein
MCTLKVHLGDGFFLGHGKVHLTSSENKMISRIFPAGKKCINWRTITHPSPHVTIVTKSKIQQCFNTINPPKSEYFSRDIQPKQYCRNIFNTPNTECRSITWNYSICSSGFPAPDLGQGPSSLALLGQPHCSLARTPCSSCCGF